MHGPERHADFPTTGLRAGVGRHSTGFILPRLYEGREPTLGGVGNLLFDPERKADETDRAPDARRT